MGGGRSLVTESRIICNVRAQHGLFVTVASAPPIIRYQFAILSLTSVPRILPSLRPHCCAIVVAVFSPRYCYHKYNRSTLQYSPGLPYIK